MEIQYIVKDFVSKDDIVWKLIEDLQLTASYLLDFPTNFLHDVIIPRLIQNLGVSNVACRLLHSIRLFFSL